MRISTTHWRWLIMVIAVAGFAGTAQAQRKVTLTLNAASIPDTIRTDSFFEVRGASNGTAPFELPGGNIIDWGSASTLEPVNIGGDYWQVTFDLQDDTELTHKFFSQQADNHPSLDGWEADPNPSIAPGTGDVTLPVHFFESQNEYRGASGDRGEYDWRPYEVKEDTVAVWFRVFMSTENALQQGYDRENASQVIGIRGGPPAGPADWSTTLAELTPESSVFGTPGYHLYSGVVYYPESAAGTTQPYKFFMEPAGWEASDDRTFTVPANDTTLHWVYFSNSAPSTAQPVQSAVIFSVDLSPLEEIGVFNRARGDTLQVRGEFNSWGCNDPDLCLLFPVPGESVYEQLIPVQSFPDTRMRYKFFLEFNDEAFMNEFGVDIVPSGWEEPLSTTGADRSFVFSGHPAGQDLGIQRFNDIYPENIIPEGETIDVNFSVDMTPALSAAEPFDPANDQVTIRVGDPIWMFTQGLLIAGEDQNRPITDAITLTDANSDMIYEGTLTVSGPTYSSIQYQYAYGSGNSWTTEAGGTTAGLGRRRTRFIAPNQDGSWPATWEFPQETFQPTGNLPFESNPAAVGIDKVDGEIPTQISLGQNYPNPFNPATSFEYTVNATQHVTIGVYDVTGRLVDTLVDGVQNAATYKVTFDGHNLASGIYFYQLKSADKVLTKKMTLIK